MSPTNPYLEAQILTASPEKLQLMMLEATMRDANEAIEHLEGGRIDMAHERLERAQSIVAELLAALDAEVDADLCARTAGLYNYVYQRLAEANVRHEVAPIRQALEILQSQRDTWREAVDRLAEMHRDESTRDSTNAAVA